MSLFEMRGAWGGAQARLYEFWIARNLDPLYDQAIEEILANDPKGPVLDLGCGAGAIAVRLAKRRPDLAVTAVDLSPEMVRRAEQRARAAGVANLTVRRADAMELPFEDSTFREVLSLASIKHWPDPARGLREIHRVLQPGGRMMIVEADRSCPFDTAWRFSALWRLSSIPIVRRATLMYFRTFVAGQSLDLDDARALMAASPFGAHEVRRQEEWPLLVVTGEKAKAARKKPASGRARGRERA